MLSIPLLAAIKNFIIFRKVVGNVLENLLEMVSDSDFFLIFLFNLKYSFYIKKPSCFYKKSVYT